jgi:hypothetical protein
MYNITAHIVRGALDAALLAPLRKLKWRLYRDDGADASLVDIYVNEHAEKWPFTQDPFDLTAAGKAKEVSLLQSVLRRADAEFLPVLTLAAFNRMLSEKLACEVLTVSSDDDALDIACRSRQGRIEEVALEYDDLDLRWREDNVDVQLLLDEEAEEGDGTPDDAFKKLKNVNVLPRTVQHQPALHHLAARKVREFLDGRETFLDLGSLDCLMRVPAPVAQSKST